MASLAVLLLLAAFAAPAGANHSPNVVNHQNMELLYKHGTGMINSDLAFWRRLAFQGYYGGFRVFSIRNPSRPKLLSTMSCYGPQNDVSVYQNILVTSVDAVLTDDDCGARLAQDPTRAGGWEGLRIFDISDPVRPRFIKGVYQDCGSHTHTLLPRPEEGRVLIYNSSYSLRPGPTCGAGQADNPVHGKIQVVEIPLNNPIAAREIAEPRIEYPGDPDNQFDPAEHGLPAPTFAPLRACHDIAILRSNPPGLNAPYGVAAGACAEQAQLWRLQANGLPDTTNPIWVFDDNVDETGITGNADDPGVAVDFWHSATFTWDGRIVNFSDESFGDGCPTTTPTFNADTGRTWFFTITGQKLSHYMIPRSEPDSYCSTHQGNVVPDNDNYYLVQAWYMGGNDVIDFTNPSNPREIAWWDYQPAGATGSDVWAHYWYEGPTLKTGSFVTYATDGIHSPATGRGFTVFNVSIGDRADANLLFLNPQTTHILFG